MFYRQRVVIVGRYLSTRWFVGSVARIAYGLPGQAAAACPYCGSGQMIESEETEGLVDPQAIAIMQVDEREAASKIIEWLGKGWTVPDDLKKSAQKSLLRPAYYPFWTFDGTLDHPLVM